MTSPVTRPSTRFGIGTAFCGLILATGQLVTAYVAFLAYMAEPAGPWDSETVSHARFASGLALVLSAVTALLTWVFTKAQWSRKWWYAISAVLALAAFLRLTVLAPTV